MLPLSISIDAIIFSVYLIINLAIGIWYSRRVKTLHDYALGRRNFSSLSLTATIVATWGSGGTFLIVTTNTYTQGLTYMIPAISIFLTLLFIGQFLAVRMKEFLGTFSVGEAMGRLYGRHVQLITAICGFVRCVVLTASQFTVSVAVLKAIFGLNGDFATVIAAVIVIVYSSLGGIRSVTFTDIVQLFMFASILPLLALIMWDALPASQHISTTLATQPQFDFSQFISNPMQIVTAIGLMVYYAVPSFGPATFQRISMAQNIRQVQKSFTYSALFFLALVSLLIWISILLLANDPHLNLANNNVITHLIDRYTTTGLKGLLAVAIMAMVMSTADSNINAATILVMQNIIKPFKIKLRHLMPLTRLLAFLIGCTGLLITFLVKDILRIALLGASFYMPVITIPLLMAILGFRSSTRAVLIGMGAGFSVVMIFLVVFGPNTYAEIRLPSGMLANMLAYLSSHYLLKSPDGWVGIQDKTTLIVARQARQRVWARQMHQIKAFRLWPYLQNLVPQQAIYYILLGIYILGVTYVSLYTMPHVFKIQHAQCYNFIRYAMLLLAASFITYPIWPPNLNTKSYITAAWPLAIFVLCIVSSLLALLSYLDAMHLQILLLNLIIVTLLLRWHLALIMSVVSFLVAMVFIHNFLQPVTITMNSTPVNIQLLYFLLLLSVVLILYFKQKYQQQNRYVAQANFLKNQYRQTTEKLIKAEKHQTYFFQKLNTQTIQSTLMEVNEQLEEADKNIKEKPEIANKTYQQAAKKN